MDNTNTATKSEIVLKHPHHPLQCHKCPYNNRTDEEATAAHLSCTGLKNHSFEGRNFLYTDKLEDNESFLGANIDRDYLAGLKHESERLTKANPETETAILNLLRDIADMDGRLAVIFWALLCGETITEAGQHCGISKQAAHKRVVAFAKTHPVFSSLLLGRDSVKANGIRTRSTFEKRTEKREQVIFDNPPNRMERLSKRPVEIRRTFERMVDAAKYLGVTRQAVFNSLHKGQHSNGWRVYPA